MAEKEYDKKVAQRPIAKRYGVIVAGLLSLIGLYIVSWYSYLFFHSVAELFSIAISFAIFIFAWNTRQFHENDFFLFLGIAYLFIGQLDFIHTLGYPGMPIFPGHETNLATQIWISARYTESVTFLIAPFFLKRKLKAFVCFFVYALVCVFALTSIFYWHNFPTGFIEGVGLTPFKKISEYIISLIFMAALSLLYFKKQAFDGDVFWLLIASIAMTIASEWAFTLYSHAYGLSSLVGHYFKIISFYLIYRAIIATGLTKPQLLLFRQLSQKEEELEKSRDELEFRVSERTKEMLLANLQLRDEIAAKEKVRQALEKSERRLSAIFRAAEDIAFVLADLAKRRPVIIEFSPGAERLFGYTHDAIIGKSIDILYAREETHRIPEIIERLRRGERGFEGESQLVRSNGESFPAFVSWTPIKEGFDGSAGLGISIDITKRKQIDEQILRTKEEWERTFDAISDIVTIMDTDMRIIRANKAAGDLLQARQDELVGKHCYDVFQCHDKGPCVGCPVIQTKRSMKASSVEIENKHLRKTFLVSSSPVLDEQGEIKAVVHVARDMSERKRLETQLRQSQKLEAIGTLTGGIAHDFNNILTPILGYAEMMLSNLPAGGKDRENMQAVLKASGRAKDLVQQLLTFSRETEQEKRPILISLIVKEALKLLRSSIPTTIEIRQNVEPGGLVLADPTQIYQIVMNLCTNAYQAMRDTGGVMEVSLVSIEIDPERFTTTLDLASGKYLRFEVRDSGHGMDERTKERVFEPYFTTKKAEDGTGLGLSVVHGIVKSLGGLIAVDSELGKGTRFHVYFPLAVTDTIVQEDEIEETIPFGKERLLVVDDENEIVKLEQKILESLGYQVVAVASSVEALRQFKDQPESFDLIITDMAMPNMNGAELAQEIMRVRADIPIIICTGFSEIIDEEKARSLGVREYIMKPVARKEMAKAIRRVLDTGGT